MSRRAGIPISIGTLLVIGAVAGFVIASEHKPRFVDGYPLGGGYFSGGSGTGWSPSAYPAARIGTWALLVVGVLLVAVGLVNYTRR